MAIRGNPLILAERARRTTANMTLVNGWPKTANISTTTTARATSCSRSSRKWRCVAALSLLLIRSDSKLNSTSTAGKGNARLRSFHLSTKGSTRMPRRDCTTIDSVIMTRILVIISVRTQLDWQEIILHCMGMCLTRICGWIYWDWLLFDYAIIRVIKGFKALKSR